MKRRDFFEWLIASALGNLIGLTIYECWIGPYFRAWLKGE